MRYYIPGVLAGLAFYIVITNDGFSQEPAPLKPEPYVCGTPRIGLHYVSEYIVDKQYVIDTEHGGMWNAWLCRPYRGEQNATHR